MFCPKCGMDNPESNAFCGKCGIKLQQNISKNSPKKESRVWIALVILAVVSTGLVSLFLLTQIFAIHAPFVGKPSVHIDDQSGAQGFAGTKITFRIYNSGDSTAQNVAAAITIYSPDGLIALESKQIYVGNLNPGDSKQLTVDMLTTGNNLTYRIVPVTVSS